MDDEAIALRLCGCKADVGEVVQDVFVRLVRHAGRFGPGVGTVHALASETIAERWTLLLLRELMLGARHFNDIHRGMPRMPPSLLSRRLQKLESTQIIEHTRVGRGIEYRLTEAGRALMPLIESLAVWGKTWMPATLSAERADPDLILLEMHRRMNAERLPDRQRSSASCWSIN